METQNQRTITLLEIHEVDPIGSNALPHGHVVRPHFELSVLSILTTAL